MDALVTWLVSVTSVLADFVKIAIGGTGGNSISILFNYQTGEGGGGGGENWQLPLISPLFWFL